MDKRCPRCEEVKPAAEFRTVKVRRQNPLGVGDYCLPCEREYRRSYRQRNVEKAREWQNAYYARTPEYRAKLAVAAQVGKNDRERLRRARTAVVTAEFVDRDKVYERDEAVCGICSTHVEREDYHMDHVIPISKGGSHTYDNVQVSHATCNLTKSDKLPAEFVSAALGRA